MTQASATSLPVKNHYDIVIAGGGMVGLSLACAIAHAADAAGLSILLVDNFPLAAAKQASPAYHPSFDARSTALSAASIDIYQTLGVLPQLLQHAQPIKQIHVSDQGHSGNALLDAQEQNKDCFGYVIENQWLGAVLLNRMNELPAIELVTGASVSEIKPTQSGATVAVTRLDKQRQLSAHNEDRCELHAGLLVVADGAQSGLRTSLGISASVKHYEQTAIIANVQTQLPHNGQAFERFTAYGAVALLPLPDLADSKNRSALVWTLPGTGHNTDSTQPNAEALLALDSDEFIAQLQKAFGFRLGAIKRVGKTQSYPLALTISDEVCRNHIVLMGNAAHSLHPVAGQGFNLALRDIAALAERVVNAHSAGQDIGSLALLEDYAQAQLADQNLTIGFSHNLIELFGLQALPVQLGRSLGLLALDLFKPAKDLFANQASGLGGRKWL